MLIVRLAALAARALVTSLTFPGALAPRVRCWPNAREMGWRARAHMRRCVSVC